jgi:DNA-binding HxlR family transcriptional regulator
VTGTARKKKTGGLTKSQQALLTYLSQSGPRYFNELVRELEGTLSRRTISKGLTVLERKGMVSSRLVHSKFTEQGFQVHHWVRKFKAI